MRQSNVSKDRRKKRRRRNRRSTVEDSNVTEVTLSQEEETREIALQEFAEIQHDHSDSDQEETKQKRRKRKRKKKQPTSTSSIEIFDESTTTVTVTETTTTSKSSSSSEETEEEIVLTLNNAKKKSKKRAKKKAKRGNQFIEVKEKHDDQINKFFDTLENDKEEREEPKCCGCCNIFTASLTMWLFHILPLIPFCIYFKVLETVPYYAGVIVIGLFVIGSLIIAGCCFYNACKPTAWCCELVGKVQLSVFGILVFISAACLILAVIQAPLGCTKNISEQIEEYICRQIKTEAKNSDSQILDGVKTYCTSRDHELVFWISIFIGCTSALLSIIFIYVGGKFRQMAQYVFHEDVFEEYKALNLLNF